MSDPPDLYDVLGVPPDAPGDDLRRAYLGLARRDHPDRHTDAPEATRAAAEARMRRVNQAWAILGDPDRRARYDADRVSRSTPPPRWRPDGGPNPEFVPFDDAPEPDAADLDDRPYPGAATVPRWAQLAPAALFAGGIVCLVVGVVIALDELAALGLGAGVLGLVGFVAVPMIAVMSSSRKRG